jgi:hypothetical protein
MIHSILVYGFPCIIILLEWILRKALQMDAYGFIGPTLAGMGIGITLPLTRPENKLMRLHSSTQKVLEREGLVAFSLREWRWTEAAWLTVFGLLGGWCLCFYLSATGGQSGQSLHWSTGMGIINYLVAVVFSISKKAWCS